MRIFQPSIVCFRRKQYGFLLVIFFLLSSLLLMFPTSRDILLITVINLPPLMRDVPTWDLIRMHLGSSAFVPPNITAEVPTCATIKFTSRQELASTTELLLQHLSRSPITTLDRESQGSWASALRASQNKPLRKDVHVKFMPVLSDPEKHKMMLTFKVS